MPMLHDENPSKVSLETIAPNRLERQGRAPEPPETDAQRKRMLVALGILLLALAAVIVKDWDFWFPSRPETAETIALRKSKAVQEQAASTATPSPPHKPEKTEAHEAPFSATTERAVLPPLQVEVVAGNQHVRVPSKSNAIQLDVGSSSSGSTTVSTEAKSAPAGVDHAGGGSDHVQLSPQTVQSLSVSVPPDYPLLARQMKVQGVVSLLALISRDGSIQELRILTGPEILATAAREAVRQWHFKPYLQNGQPVETQAKITVNFTISTN